MNDYLNVGDELGANGAWLKTLFDIFWCRCVSVKMFYWWTVDCNLRTVIIIRFRCYFLEIYANGSLIKIKPLNVFYYRQELLDK